MFKIKNHFASALLLSVGLTQVVSAQTGTFTSMSMASYGPLVAPDSIAAGFGANLAAGTTVATLPLQTNLGNVQVSFLDSAGAKLAAPLYMVSPMQVNYLVPANAALGKATVTVTTGTGTLQGTLLISNVAPGIATANNSGQGVPAAQLLRVSAGVSSVQTVFMSGPNNMFVPSPITLPSAQGDSAYFMLYGTGFRRHSLNPVKASVNGVSVPVLYAGAQSQYPGLDQVNVGPLPQSLAGKGQVNLIVTVDGVPSNTVTVAFQ